MKKCYSCKLVLDLSAFGNNRHRADGRQEYCRECGRAKDRKNYRGSAERRRAIRERADQDRRRCRAATMAYLATHPCVDCGESDPIVLEFDHRDRTDKVDHVSQLVNKGMKAVLAEIGKCDVRCANCHRRRTAKQLGYYAGVA